jgi:hypothetical protein
MLDLHVSEALTDGSHILKQIPPTSEASSPGQGSILSKCGDGDVSSDLSSCTSSIMFMLCNSLKILNF